MTRRLIAMMAVAFNIAVVAACSPVPSEQDTTGTTPGAAPRPSVALVTHQPPGDTFWDLVRRGAQAAADKDGIDLRYLHDPDPAVQARLVTEAVGHKVAGIAVTLPDPPALARSIRQATAAGIPVVALNTAIDAWASMGILSYFGQDDAVAGRAAGTRLTRERTRSTLCVIQAAGHIGLAARCDGAASTFEGVVQRLNVDGTRPADVKAALVAKLQQDRGIDRILTLSAAVALTALQAVGEANSYAKVVTFDTNPAVIEAIKRGTIVWAIDQQPYLQGYLAVDSLSLYVANKNVVGGGLPTLTGPSFVDESNVDAVAERAQEGTR
jgi:simple sugar transport system substrate-binding protein